MNISKKIFIFFLLWAVASPALGVEEKRVVIQDIINSDGLKHVRIYLNYTDPTKTTHVMRQTNWQYDVELPISSRWEVVKASLRVKYVSSIALVPSRSLIAIGLNDRVLFQNMLNRPDVPEQVKLKLPPADFKEFNKVFFRSNQHYTLEGCEDETSPELWTELDIGNSYIDLVIREKDVPERVCSVFSYLFDKKSLVKERLNFVFPELPADEDLYRNAFLAGSLGKYLSYRDVIITADRELKEGADNIIVGLRKDVTQFLFDSLNIYDVDDKKQLKSKLSGNINMIANPVDPKRALLVFTGESGEELDRTVQSFPSLDFTIYTDSSITILENVLPRPAEAYSAPYFVPIGKKVLFSELGFSTTTFTGIIDKPGEMSFKIYPDSYFERKGQVKMFLHIIYPRMVRFDSIINLMLNNRFIHQVALDYNEREKDTFVQEWLDLDRLTEFPVYLVNKGMNNLAINSTMIPFKKGKCEIFNRENLQVTVMDDSYIKLPSDKRWVEMPYLDYIASAAYPYSIYPDLSDTAILLTDTSSTTLATALQTTYFLAKHIDYPPYELTITSVFNEAVKDKQLILIGNSKSSFSQLLEGAPLYFSEAGTWKKSRFIDRFIESLPYFSPEKLDKKKYAMDTLQANEELTSLVVQMYKSPYNPDKTVLAMLSDDGNHLLAGVRKILSPQMLGSLKGDVTVLSLCEDCPDDPTEIAPDYNVQWFNINPKYYQGDVGQYDKIRFEISENPVQLLIISLFVVITLVLVIRALLKRFKEKHHKNAEK
ncbi:MAG: cellulose biosynthesis cyclic di-GMP-binding regulatory protein BcsB [Desulfobulbaceae bacterium]|nr:cellulose biosynthesis cyclic di-GMP-binding regulatory protein BcsB [Desulfobulbaceae bacterium]